MNELFNNGDYVLLEDCKAFDEKFGLEEGTTMWDVARKLEGGEPDEGYMDVSFNEVCVGVYNEKGGLWTELVCRSYATKLSVEDVLYRSKDGLTLDELSKIHGAFEEGKQYECVYSPEDYIFNVGEIYHANGDGIVDVNNYTCKNGFTVRFKPATKSEWVPTVGEEVMTNGFTVRFKPATKFEWVPNVGDEVIASDFKVTIKLIKDKQACVEFESGSIDVVQLSCLKPIDQDRERIIDEAYNLGIPTKRESTLKEFCEKLYDAGMLKEGDK